MKTTEPTGPSERPDHRVQVAARKRALMRARLLQATMKVYAEVVDRVPVIEDVIRAAEVSRGTFYLHFISLEEALHAISLEQSDKMTTDILPVYDILKEPWQRFAVGFRLFLHRARADPEWASFVTRSNTISDKLLVTTYMRHDIEQGLATGCFAYGDLDAAVDFMMGASVAAIRALGMRVPVDSDVYIDSSVRIALTGLGCTARLVDKGAKFAGAYLADWTGTFPSDAS